MSIQQERFLEIANAIREKTGETEPIKPSDFVGKVHSVFKAGKTDEWSEFWDVFQRNGARTAYQSAFSNEWWSNVNFKPKYDMTPSRADLMFYRCKIGDLKGILEDYGVSIDFSQSTNFSNCFQESSITEIGVVDLTGTTAVSSLVQNCYYLNGIEKIIVKESNTFNDVCFYNCSSLLRIKVEGVIGNNIGFAKSPLIKESIVSIINALSGTASGKTLTLKLSAVQKAFETSSGANDGSASAEWVTLAATKSNWTITLV